MDVLEEYTLPGEDRLPWQERNSTSKHRQCSSQPKLRVHEAQQDLNRRGTLRRYSVT